MSPDQRAELELLVAAHTPPIAGSERERLLFESARELGRQLGSRQAARKSVAAAAVSCGLTLLLSWAVMPGLREGLSPAGDAMPGASLADNQLPNPLPSPQPIAKSAVRNSAEPITASQSVALPTNSLPFDRNILTPASWSAQWELSHLGQLSVGSANIEPADGRTATGSADLGGPSSTPLRAGTPIDHL